MKIEKLCEIIFIRAGENNNNNSSSFFKYKLIVNSMDCQQYQDNKDF